MCLRHQEPQRRVLFGRREYLRQTALAKHKQNLTNDITITSNNIHNSAKEVVMITRYVLIAMVLVIGTVVALPQAHSSPKGKKVLVHVISNIKKDDGPPCVAFDIAYANLMAGNRVEMFFDADAAWNLKRTDNDGKNDFDRYDMPADLKQLLVAEFKNEETKKVKNFGEFLALLSSKGAVISVNGTWNVLTSVEKEIKGKTKMPSFVEPLTLKEMVGHMNTAERYYRY